MIAQIEFRCACGYTTDSLTDVWEHIRAYVHEDSYAQRRVQRARTHNMMAVVVGTVHAADLNRSDQPHDLGVKPTPIVDNS